jgi:hypothetical protein
MMNLPKIDLSSLPDLEMLTGLFGSVRRGHDDTIVIMATFIFEAGA